MEISSNPGSAPVRPGGLMWRRIAPDELKRQVEEYETLGPTASARGMCAVLAAAIGLGNLLVGAFTLVYAFVEAEPMGGWRSLLGIMEFEAFLAFGLTSLVIGIVSLSQVVPVRRGNPNALRAVAVAWAAAVLANGGMWLLQPVSAWQAAAGILFLLAGWFAVSRFFTAALRVESGRRQMAQG